MSHRLSIAICASILLIASAAAQTVAPLSPSPEMATRTFQGGSSQRPDGAVRVQSTISYFVPGPSGDSDEGQKLRERARRVIYETAGRECDLLKDTLAKDCRLESVNSNINRQFGQGQQEGFSVNGSMSFQIILK